MSVVTWEEPDDTDDVADVEIWRCATEDGTYTLIDTIDAVDGDGDWVTTYDDTTGENTDWYKLRFKNSADLTGLYSTARQTGYSNITYTTIQIVRDEIKDMSSSISDDMIRKYIQSAETEVDMTMRTSFKSTFDASKHGPIRRLTTKLAAKDCLQYDIANTIGSTSASVTLDNLNSEITRLKNTLSVSRNVIYLQSL